MPFHQSLQAWRQARRLSISRLAAESGLEGSVIEAIESGATDPSLSMVEALARGLAIPPAWVHSSPDAVALLLGDLDGDGAVSSSLETPDPVTERMLQGNQTERDMYVLLTALLRHGDAKLIRAADVNLRSLLRQARTADVPWQSRPPGHFEPPSD